MLPKCSKESMRMLLPNIFRNYYAPVVVKYPWWFILGSLISCIILCAGFTYFPYRRLSDINELYTPRGAAFWYEQDAIRSHVWGSGDHRFDFDRGDYKQSASAIISLRNTSDEMMKIGYLDGIIEFNNHVMYNISVTHDLSEHTFQQICLEVWPQKCKTDNRHANIIRFYLTLDSKQRQSFHLTYPKLAVGGNSIQTYIGSAVGGVGLIPGTNVVKGFKSLFLIYTFDMEKYGYLLEGWEKKYVAYAKDFSEDNKYGLHVDYSDTVAVLNGLLAATKEAQPKLSITFSLLLAFCVISNYRFNKNSNNNSKDCNISNMNYTSSSTKGGDSISNSNDNSKNININRTVSNNSSNGNIYNNNNSIKGDGSISNFNRCSRDSSKDIIINRNLSNNSSNGNIYNNNNKNSHDRNKNFTGQSFSLFGKTCSYSLDKNRSKPYLGALGTIASSMGIVASIGLLMFTGSLHDSNLQIMPFLVVSIGVDDMFVMLSAWRRTNPRDSVLDRTKDMMGESVVSVTITSVTSAVSFAVGIFAPMKAVSLFCTYTSVGILLNYVYQITFFAGCMVISGRMEEENIWSCCSLSGTQRDSMARVENTTEEEFGKKRNENGHDPTLAYKQETCADKASRVARFVENADKTSGVARFLENKVAPKILHSSAQPLVLLLMVAYLAVAIYGCTRLKEEFNPQKVFPPKFYGAKLMNILKNHYWSCGVQVHVVVGNAPNFSIAENRNAVETMIRGFEKLPHVIEKNATEIWIPEFSKFVGRETADYNDPYTWSKTLLQWSEMATVKHYFGDDLSWRPATLEEEESCNCKQVLRAFKFRIATIDFHQYDSQISAMVSIRRQASRYPQFNVSVYYYDFAVFDQYLIMLPVTLQNVGLAILCMIIIAACFIPNLCCIICVGITIVSVDIGIFGFLALWGVDLDAISMICIIMSIGLSVDYTAHVAYAYDASKHQEANKKAQDAIATVGIPVFEGAVSTLLGTLALATLTTYMGQVFFKTVILVIILGIFHAILFLPVMLVVTDNLLSSCTRK